MKKTITRTTIAAICFILSLLSIKANAQSNSPITWQGFNAVNTQAPTNLNPTLNTAGNGITLGSQGITVNDTTDIRVSPSSHQQSEVHISLNLSNPNNVLASSNTYTSTYQQGYYTTSNGGNTWSGSESYPNETEVYGDPSTAFDQNGNAFMSTLNNGATNYLITKSSSGGTNWSTPISGNANTTSFDKEMIAVDNTNSAYAGNIYCAWTDFGTSNDDVKFNRSIDGGNTFSSPIILKSTHWGQGTNVQVGPNGEVYVCWADYPGSLPATGIGFTKSLDGGVTFSAAMVAFPSSGIRTSNGPLSLFGNTRVNDFPSMAVDKSCGNTRGRIYITYPEKKNGTGKAIIEVRYSDDEGSTWSSPTEVSIPNASQSWMPWIAVDDVTGMVCVDYFSLDQSSGFSTNTYLAYSSDGGNTWDNVKVSDVSHTTAPISGNFSPGYAGDYIGITAHNNKVYPAWMDDRNGTWQIYVSPVTFDATPITPTVDVYMKDVPEDFGVEPASYPANTLLYISSDIWTRNQLDTIEQQQNIEYDPNNPAYVYVKIRNRSCVDLPADTAEIHVYFAKAGTFWANWPYPWTNVGGNPPVGGEIGSINIPTIPAGGQKIVHIPWDSVPNPQWYSSWPPNQIHHFCILARIVSNADTMYSELTGTPSTNVLSHNISWNNNIVMKNVSVVDFQHIMVGKDKPILNDHAAVTVGNPLNNNLHSTKLRFHVPEEEPGNPITKDAEVKVLLDPTIWEIWQSGGAKGTGIRVFNPDNHEILITQSDASLTNLNFPPRTTGNIAVRFNFYTDHQDGKNNFTYDLTQISDTGVLLGGERFQIIRPQRQQTGIFEANISQDNSYQNANNTSLTAQNINEPAVYRWYTADTSLIDTGMNIMLNSIHPLPALLSVTADSDGYKDYVALNNNSLQNINGSTSQTLMTDSIVSINPNPATNQVTVTYHIGSTDVQSAQLKITYINPAIFETVTISQAQNQKIVNTTGLPSGVFVISLYVNGQQKDSKQLVIQ